METTAAPDPVQQAQPPPRRDDAPPERKVYVRPELIVHGDVAALTKGKPGANIDGVNGSQPL